MQLPQHLAIIMDGNGRWAEQQNLPRVFGHRRGVEAVKLIVEECRSLGIPYLTLYAFSSENWGRPAEEVNALMELLGVFLEQELDNLIEQDIRLNVIGDIQKLPARVRGVLSNTMLRTGDNRKMVLTLALSYGARNEIIRAVRNLGEKVASGELDVALIDEDCFSRTLDTGDLPDPDFLVRTSGEMRISNFLLWQLAYAELFFSDVLWPDFDIEQLHHALDVFGSRQRRFGLTARQVDPDNDIESEEGPH